MSDRTWEEDARRLGIDPALCRVGPTRPIPRAGRWTFTIPGWRPALDNELVGRHPMTVHRLKRRDARRLQEARLAFGVPEASVYRRRVSLMISGRYSTFPDDTAPLKSFWDALTTAGLIVDDSRKWLEFVFPPLFLRGKRSTTITIEDLVDTGTACPVRYPDEDTADE